MKMTTALLALAFAATGCVSGERELVRGYAGVYSPDGKYVAFEQDEGTRRRVGIVQLKTGKVVWPDLGPGSSCHAAFAPDGDLYYVYGNVTNTNYELYKANPGTGYNVFRYRKGKAERVTTGFCHDMTPAVSPDGRTLYFASTRDDRSKANNSIFTLDLTDAAAKPVMAIAGTNNYCSGVTSPAVSPDGKTVVYGFYGGWTPPYYVMSVPVDGSSEPMKLTREPEFAFAPRFDPSGRYVCYTSVLSGERYGVRILELGTGRSVRLADGREPAFSPDGRRLIYERDGVIYERDWNPEEVMK